jgi:hypothetical protein
MTTSSGATPRSLESAKVLVTVPQTKEGRSPHDDAVISAEGQSARAVNVPAAEEQSIFQEELISKHGTQVGGKETDAKTPNANETISPDMSGQESGVSDQKTNVLSRKDLQLSVGQMVKDGGTEGVRPDTEPVFGGIPIERPVPLRSEGHVEALSNHDSPDVRTTQTLPADHQSTSNTAEDSNQLWSDHNGQEQEQEQPETKLPQAAGAESRLAQGQRAEPLVVGVATPTTGTHPTPPPTVSTGSQTSPTVPASGTVERLFPGTRSVVFDVAQPDLGHVNIRVAMMNDVVHTFLSADRSDVGQFLMNGQDRLQAAFQANGLDMGQFRVDIDRQGAGRSFQQGQFQDQGHTWNQGSHGMEQEHRTDRLDDRHMSLHGLLNVVA